MKSNSWSGHKEGMELNAVFAQGRHLINEVKLKINFYEKSV